MKVSSLLLSLAVAAFVVTQSAQAADFYPISSVSASTSDTDLWPVSNLIQGPGVGYDAAEPHDSLGGVGSGTAWVTADPGGFPSDYIEAAGTPVLVFDLGADVSLTEISVWNYSDSNTNGAAEISVAFATEADGADGFGSSIMFNPVLPVAFSAEPRQSLTFGQTVNARYVEVTVTDNYFDPPGDGTGMNPLAGGDRVGLREVAFEVIPEPTSAAIALGALSVVTLRRRSRG